MSLWETKFANVLVARWVMRWEVSLRETVPWEEGPREAGGGSPLAALVNIPFSLPAQNRIGRLLPQSVAHRPAANQPRTAPPPEMGGLGSR